MKKNIVQFMIALAFSLIYILPAQAQPETYTLDPKHTYMVWHIKHFDFSTQEGKWYVSGTMVLDKDNPQNSKVDASIKIADMVTGLPDLDKHLKDKLFFDASKYPLATFVSKKVDVTGQNTANVEGILTLHGVSKPVVLNVTLNKTGENPISNKMSAGFTASTTIKRSDFGMNTLLPGLGDDVKIDIEAEAYKS